MAAAVIDQDRAVKDLMAELSSVKSDLASAYRAEAHLRGYVERVKEMDGDPLAKVRAALDG